MKKLILITVLSVFTGLCHSQTAFGPQQIITTDANGASSVYSIDLDNDGDNDVLSASQGDNKIAWYENDGLGGFGYEQIISSEAFGAASVYSIDLNNDGDNDVLSASYEDEKVAWYENDGIGGFGYEQIIKSNTNVYGLVCVYSIDLDNDGDNDVLSASGQDDIIAWHENDGNGGFGNQQIITTEVDGTNSVYSIDLDNDGDNDVLSASFYDNKIAWYENDGIGGFGNQQIITTEAGGATSVYSIDLDNDGDNDVLFASYYDNKIAWYENDGIGGFGNQQIITTDASEVSSVYSIDLDNDGDNDVLFSSISKIAWYENDGIGGFSNQQIITTEVDGATSVYSIDLNNDGDNDVLSASFYDNKIAWHENLFNQVYTNNVEMCDGDSLMINGEWISSPGVYTSTFTNVLGGDSIVTTNLSVLPVPGDFEIIGPYEVAEFATETYSVPVNPDVEYGFEVENGNILSTEENSIEVQWAANSMGSVKAIATFPETGCNTESILEVTVGTGGIDEFSQFNIKLYPNPANQSLFIESDILPVRIEIYNSTGQLFKKSRQTKLDISGLESDIYYVKVFDKHDNILRIEKLVIAR